MSELTARQRQVLEYLEQIQARRGVIPSTREIQEHFGFASQTAALNHLRALERKGVILREAGKARSVSIVSQMGREPILDIPIYGQIAAGLGEAGLEEENVGTISLDCATAGLSPKGRHFALKVRGDSMIGAQIAEGDMVILEQRPAKNGDIVAALIDGETTLKRLIISPDGTWLKAENPNFPDLEPIEELRVQGVLVTLIRRCA